MKKIYVLNTYNNNNSDEGLSVVYHYIKNLGTIVNTSRHIKNSIVIVAGIPHMYINRLSNKNINICYTTYEFFPLPKLWIQCLNAYSTIIVPHSKIKELFENSGVKRPIHIVQQGYPKRIPYLNMKDSNKFTVGFCGVPVKRKNLDLLIKAIETLKTTIPNIVLKVHISKYYREMTPYVFPSNCSFDVTYGYKTDDELSKWYSSLDAYIFPSSGEGWSFTPRESLSLSIPTIISDCLVHKDLEKYSKMIDLPVTQTKIEDAIVDVYKNIEVYKSSAIEGRNYVELHNKTDDMFHQMSNIIAQLG